jgi:hypothetical protein
MIASSRGGARGRIPATVPVVLYITRFHPFIQGFSGVYRKIIGFPPPGPEALIAEFQAQTQPVGSWG